MHSRLRKAINHVIFSEPFYGSLLPRLAIYEDRSCPTMATNGKSIIYNSAFVDSCTDMEIRGVVIHELFHCIMMHMYRRGSRDAKKWNVAGDYAINPLVLETRQCTLPKGTLIDTNRFPAGTSAEKIYDLLKDDEIPQDFVIDLHEVDPESKLAEEIDWRGAVSVAATNAKKAGKLSRAVEQVLSRMLYPKLPWQQLLYAFMTEPKDPQTTWFKPNRHYIAHDIFLPGKIKEATGDFVVSYDVSGSMQNQAIKDSLTEIGFIINEINPRRVILIEHDSMITGEPRIFESDDDLPTEIEIKGRGGTDFNPVFDYVNDLDEMPEAVILFTDGYGPHPEYPPEYPVLWIMVDTDPDLKMNFGEQIWLDS